MLRYQNPYLFSSSYYVSRNRAGGVDGVPRIPKKTYKMLTNENFAGSLFHSTQVNEFEGSVKGSRIVLVGGNYSAEDLALQLIKYGAEEIYIIIRKEEGEVSSVGAWPGNKVKIIPEHIVSGVTDDKKGIICSEVAWDPEDDTFSVDSACDDYEISNVDAVIFCTGYEPNFDMLSTELRSWYHLYEDDTISLPADWKPKPNSLDHLLGHVTPHDELYSDLFAIQHIYRYHLIHNPDMMFVFPTTGCPILEIDTIAWYFVAYVCGDVVLPTRKQMQQENKKFFLEEMNVPFLRYVIDNKYRLALDNVPEDNSINDYTSDIHRSNNRECYVFDTLMLARNMIAGNYPVRFGTENKLNELGEKFVDMNMACCCARTSLCKNSSDTEWKTFRDCDPEPFSSLYTASKAQALEGRWINLNDDGSLMM